MFKQYSQAVYCFSLSLSTKMLSLENLEQENISQREGVAFLTGINWAANLMPLSTVNFADELGDVDEEDLL